MTLDHLMPFIAGLHIAAQLVIGFSVLCYILLPIYLIFRLGRNAEADRKRHRELMFELRRRPYS
jgi:hypothetical protein